jgi:hypothetical protein
MNVYIYDDSVNVMNVGTILNVAIIQNVAISGSLVINSQLKNANMFYQYNQTSIGVLCTYGQSNLVISNCQFNVTLNAVT